MRIAGIQKLSLLDYPGRIACTVFLPGCNFRCPFCHNASIVLNDGSERFLTGFSSAELYDFLEARKGKLEAVCISGGEPMLQPELKEMIRTIRQLGYRIKLDTNGSFPERLEELFSEGLLDYVAMDVKNSPKCYAQTTGCLPELMEKLLPQIDRSIGLLKESGVEYEFRTTVVEEYHTEESMTELAQWLEGASRYYLQQFEDSGHLLAGTQTLHALPEKQMQQLLEQIRPYIPAAALRGV